MANRQKTIYCCTDCGYETANWAGKCPSCGAWNTLSGVRVDREGPGKTGGRARSASAPKRLQELELTEEIRFSTGISEFDRVLGGGAVVGSLVLVGGAPGIGKSTLLLQMCSACGGRRILYVSGEESERQLKLRADRLGVSGGVSNNQRLRRQLQQAADREKIPLFMPKRKYCGDNAAMIAFAAPWVASAVQLNPNRTLDETV